MYVVEGTRIRKITPAGTVSTFINEDASRGILLSDIICFLSDGYGRFYYPYLYNHVRTLTVNGGSKIAGSTTIKGFQDGQSNIARFKYAMSIARDSKGNLYVPDHDENKQNKFFIRKITPAGDVSSLSLNDQTGILNEPVPGDKLFHSIAIDSADNIYFTAGNYLTIKKADLQGNVTVLAGATTTGFKDGKGQDAQFNIVSDLEVDNAGNVWVCDADNYAIRKIAPDGTVTTIAGNGTPGYVNGEGAKARFSTPNALTIDKNGIIYLTETTNHTIRKIEYRQ